jgi:energy-coupling factor transporter ATP-binding protein EcfA2
VRWNPLPLHPVERALQWVSHGSRTIVAVGASRFFLCDLQVHTPADKRQGYGDVGGRDPNPEFARRLIEAHAQAGVEVIAVTDHNRVDWYPALREAGDELGVYVFPGLEFSVNRCHLLTIWERTDQGFDLARQFLARLWDPGASPFEANGDPRAVSKGAVRDWVETASREFKALVFAPHATMKDIGFLAKGVCTNRKDVIETGLIAGFDVWGNTRADVLGNPATDFTSARPSWFISGDVRSFDDVGKRATYLKLGSTPTLEALRQAFLVPATRIRFHGALRKDLARVTGIAFLDDPTPSWPRIERMTVTGGFHDGLDVSFGPGLNALIGGKGTGKSTLIEILRYVLHAGDPIEDEAAGNRKHNFRANAEASVTYFGQDSERYSVLRSGGSDPAKLVRQGIDLGMDVTRRVKVRVFGQRELQSLAQQNAILREFVAAEAGEAWIDAVAKEKAELQAIREHDSAILTLENQLTSLGDDEQELIDLKDRVARADTKGAAELVTRSSELTAADTDMRIALAWPEGVAGAVTRLEGVLPAPDVPELPENGGAVAAALAELSDAVASAATELRAALSRSQKTLAEEAERWDAEHAAARADIERKLAEAGLEDPRELGQMQAKVRELEAMLSGLPSKRTKLGESKTKRNGALQRLAEVRRLKSRLVEAAARDLTERIGSRVRVRVEPLADVSQLARALEAAVKGQSVKSDQLKALAAKHSPTTIASAIREGAANVEALGCSAATASKLCAVASDVVRALEEVDTPDRIIIEVNLAGAADDPSWQDVVNVSPGQSAMALLALALAGGSEPLVIDQPEDDLDNRYIYDEVVKVLADICQRRQVIVATHNANIPILGDAELVLALDADGKEASVLACGGLEDPTVTEWARRILEGGEAAFQARHRRYQAGRI